MGAKIRGERADRVHHMAQAITAIAKGNSTWRQIASEVGITMRATFDLLRVLEKQEHIHADRPNGIQVHNTKTVKYRLLEDLGNFVYYIDLIGSDGNDMLKTFMLTDYFLKTARGICEIVSKHAEASLTGYFLYSSAKKEVSNEDAQRAALILSQAAVHYEKTRKILPEAKTALKDGWVFYEDPLVGGMPVYLHLSDLKKAIYGIENEEVGYGDEPDMVCHPYRMVEERMEVYDSLKGIFPDSYVRLLFPRGRPKLEEDPYKAKLELTRELLPAAISFDTFDKVQRMVAIARAAVNDGVFLDVMFRVISSFPDSVLSMARRIKKMVEIAFPGGYDPTRESLLFENERYKSEGLHVSGFRRGPALFYIAEGSVSELLLLDALFAISNENAIVPDTFLEKYVIGDIRP